ncbi:MAG: High-affnity carbon uptake protein Hat/HatR, partial [Cyclobacteriaceae bacterium]|nr:High-affnity carbon uptake protein Hat/HatR [Cyclobacteriaceae bacterium]
CGVLPILYGGFLTEVASDWEVVVMRPGAGPIDNLAEALLNTDQGYKSASTENKKIKKTIISTLLRSSSLGLVEALEQLKKTTNKNYLILVDQFEELFRFKDSRDAGAVDETLAFINLLLEAVDYKDSPIYVALTMRSDFIGECAQFADLTKKINDSHYLIPQMTRDQKRKAIEGPVAVGGATISSRLVQRLLNDLGDNPDQLPILQHSLMRTWDYWRKYKDSENEPVDIRHYESIGTMSEALSLHANEAYDELDEKQKVICEFIFKAITEKRGENFGIRRPTRLGDIASISNSSVEAVAGVIEKFRQPGRSLLTPAHGIPLNDKSIVDISHESLMRIWVRLKNWVEDEADAVQMYVRLAEAAGMYQLGKSGLWRPPDLQLALNWEAKHRPTLIWAQRYHPAFERTMEFLSHSKKEYDTEQRIKELQAKRRLKTARVTAMVMASLCVVAVGFLLFAFDQKTTADEKTIEAQDNLAQALRQTKISDSLKTVADDAAEDAAREAKRASEEAENAKIQRQIADSASVVAQFQAEEALKQAELARQRGDTAEVRRLEAVAAQLLADRNAQEARNQEELAKQQMYLAQARTMGFSSQSMKGEQFEQLKGLLAQQAYLFNVAKDGYPYEGSIYYALYDALKQFEDDLTITHEGNYNNSDGDILLIRATSSNIVYSIHQNGQIYAWRTSSGSKVRNYDVLTPVIPLATIKTAVLSKDEKTIVIAGKMGDRSFAQIINTASPENPTEIELTGFGITDAYFAPNNDLYLLNNQGSSLWLYKNNSAKEVIKPTEKLNVITVSKDGKDLYGGSAAGKVILYDLNNNYNSKIIFQKDQTS